MQSKSVTDVRKPGFLSRLIGAVRKGWRRLVGKSAPEEPNIYPFF